MGFLTLETHSHTSTYNPATMFKTRKARIIGLQASGFHKGLSCTQVHSVGEFVNDRFVLGVFPMASTQGVEPGHQCQNPKGPLESCGSISNRAETPISIVHVIGSARLFGYGTGHV